jgi:hypothetical protein
MIIGLIIGLPSIVVGCNDLLCPLHEKVMGNVTDSRYLVTQCTKDICDGEGENCQNIRYDCSHWISTVSYSQGNKSCDIGTGPHDPGTNIWIYVNKMNSECQTGFDQTIRVLPIIGVIFLSICGLAFLVQFIWCCLECDDYDNDDD